jgi:phosphoglycerate dehydrogenase-like enzyme
MGAQVLHTSSRDDGHPEWRSLPELLAVSDIVSLHLPLTERTHHLLDRAALTSMKPGAVIVNTSRGGVVDGDALVEALRTGHLAAAGHPLLTLDNVVLTPHVSWCTVDTLCSYLAEAIENCRRMRDGAPLANVVNGVGLDQVSA